MQRMFRDLPTLLRTGMATTTKNFGACSLATAAVIRPIVPMPKHICRRNYSKPMYDAKQLQEIDKEFQSVSAGDRTKFTFMAAIELFSESRGRRGRGQVEFIKAALKNMERFGLHKDLDVYKSLLKVFPKGVMIPQNKWQKMFLHYPSQQLCCIEVLEQIDWLGVQPDKELHDIVVNAFGQYNYASKKAKRMLYWMPKLKYTNKYLDRREVENRNLKAPELARTALKMMCRDSGTVFSYIQTPSTEEDYGKWIVSAQSPLQSMLIRKLSHQSCCYVDGPYRVYVMDKQVQYVVFSSDPTQEKDEELIDQRTWYEYSNLHERLFDVGSENETNMHQQSDQTILAMAVMESNTQNCASAWVNYLQKNNSALSRANILLRIKEEPKDLQLTEDRSSV